MDNKQNQLKIRITTEVCPGHNTITQHITDYCGLVSKSVFNVREKHLREALIKMGWTPPKE